MRVVQAAGAVAGDRDGLGWERRLGVSEPEDVPGEDRADDAAVTDIIRRERQRERAIREIEVMKGEGRWNG